MSEDTNKNKYSNNLKRDKVLFYMLLLLITLVFGGIGYAFFSAAISNANHEEIATSTATLSLVFDDNDNGISGTLSLGQSITKKFTLENTGTVDAYGKINWYNLVNTYTGDSLTWTLERSTSANGSYTSVGGGKVPTSSTATTAVLKNGLLVPVNTTYYYKLTITLNNLNIDQSSDINAHMNSKFSLEAGTKPGTDTIMELVAGEPINTTNVITKTAPEGATCTNTLAYDGTSDNNLRYVGANPCNYVTFNGESPSAVTVYRIMNKAGGYDAYGESFSTLETCNSTNSRVYSWSSEYECQEKHETIGGWRIVGIMNNIDDGTGNLETRIKLIRNDALGEFSWDSSASSVNSGYGVNDWSQADLMQELNGDYLNTSLNANTNWYDGSKNTQSATFDYTKRLSATAQSLIGDAKWYLGGFADNNANLITNTMYTLERGTTVWGSTSGQTCNDGACPRATEWTGKVALIYPSDYGYATAGGTTTNRNTCIGTLSTYFSESGETWSNSSYSYSDCYLSDWIPYQWVLSPKSNSSTAAFFVRSRAVSSNGISPGITVRPAVYLKSNVSITGGNGTTTDPYTLS